MSLSEPCKLRMELQPDGSLKVEMPDTAYPAEFLRIEERSRIIPQKYPGCQRVTIRKCWRRRPGSRWPRRNGRVLWLKDTADPPRGAPLRRVLDPGKVYVGNYKGLREIVYVHRSETASRSAEAGLASTG